jgi:hypothetical protein
MAFALVFSGSVSAAQINHQVLGTDNLYYTDWGHWFTLGGTEDQLDNALAEPGSTAARAVNFNFSGVARLDITAAGTVVDAGVYATGADGCMAFDPVDCAFGADASVYGQTAYTLIGLWSTSATEINPVYVGGKYTGNGDPYDDFLDAVFLLGSSASLVVPDLPEVYLFLAENDGIWSDNSGAYDVLLEYSHIPLPAALPLFLSGLGGLAFIRARKRVRPAV